MSELHFDADGEPVKVPARGLRIAFVAPPRSSPPRPLTRPRPAARRKP